MKEIALGPSRAMRDVAATIRLVAERRCTLLITGETGTGKEVVARAVHAAGNRAVRQLVALNCAAVPETLLEAELFGHVRGAFTGASAPRTGRFEQADGGTLFLDEIGDMPLSLQAKLLRVLQEREFQRLGSSETVRVDFRLIAATNTDLAALVREGKFREDLFYRLSVVPIHLLPLRERAEDIPYLVNLFLDRICEAEGLRRKQISREALDWLARLNWPGNVRQLENAVEMAVALSGERMMLELFDFATLPAATKPVQAAPRACVEVPEHGLDYESTVGGIELDILRQALEKAGGNKTLAANLLGLKRTTLTAKLRSLEGFEPLARAAGV
jgi:transcriptional regulator with GAF, ATPase, and Fis domain